MRGLVYLLCAIFLSGCSVQGLYVKGNSLDSYKGSAAAPEIYPVTGGYAVKAALHNHTNLSHAALTPQELVEVARSRGIAVLGIAEHDSLEACWSGLFCFRNPSVQRMGYAAYLAQMRDLQQQNPDVIVLPGLEVSPYAWWSGFPPLLTLRDWDVHFTVYNLESAEILDQMPIPGARYPRCCSYHELSGIGRYRDFVSYLTAAGGLVFQAHPESAARRRFYLVAAETAPHPEYAYLLQELTGFAALPAGTGKLLEPGGLWDSALAEYLAGKRPRPLWILGDADFHGADQKLDRVVTWLYTAGLDKADMLRAMAGGRMVAGRGGALDAVWVKEFALAAPDDPPGRVMCGESVRDPKATTLRFALSRSAPGLALKVIRNGSVIYSGDEPEVVLDESAFLAGEQSAFYRVEVSDAGGVLLVTNPVFRPAYPAPTVR